MSLAANFQGEGHGFHGGAYLSSYGVNSCDNTNRKRSRNNYNNWNYGNYCDYWAKCGQHSGNSNFYMAGHPNYMKLNNAAQSSLKRRKHSASTWENCCSYYLTTTVYDSIPSTSASCKLECSRLEDEDLVFLSRDEIDRLSPSRKDGIDALYETNLRYSYCAFLQDLGMRLELPQTTTGTAMVLCHRFFVWRSHACHDRFLIATATLFLAAKSEDTPRPLNNVLQASCEILRQQNYAFLPYLPVDWFEQYRERVLEAETLILTTLNFELNVQHPYAPLTSILAKLGLSQTALVNLALQLISEGMRDVFVVWRTCDRGDLVSQVYVWFKIVFILLMYILEQLLRVVILSRILIFLACIQLQGLHKTNMLACMIVFAGGLIIDMLFLESFVLHLM